MAGRIVPWMFAVVILAGASLTLVQPGFGLFGQAYGVGGAGVTAAFVPPSSTAAVGSTPVSPVVGTQSSSAAAPPPTAATTPTPVFMPASAPSVTPTTTSTTPRAVSPTTSPVATRTPVATATARSTGTPAVSETIVPGPTPCLTARPALKFEPDLQRAPAGGPVKVRFALQNGSTADVAGALLRVVTVAGIVDVAEARIGDASLKRLAGSPSEVLFALPPLPGSARPELVLVLEARAEAELRLEVIAPDCGRRDPDASASARLLLLLPAARDEAPAPALTKPEAKESSGQQQPPAVQVSSGEKR